MLYTLFTSDGGFPKSGQTLRKLSAASAHSCRKVCSWNNGIEKNDTTVANKTLPKAGNAFLGMIIITCVALIIFLIINYKKYQKYKKV